MLSGGCQCGAVRYRVGAEPSALYVCHCTECRAQSSSAFGISVIVPLAALELLSGRPKTWSRSTASGRTLDCAFCPDCGSRLWHLNDPPSADVAIKGGSIYGGIALTDAIHIWTKRKLPGVVIPRGAVQWPGEPA